jgi:hypothetical protein
MDNYKAVRKLLNINSIDRDISKYPNSNTFEIVLPQSVKRVLSIKLLESNFPNVIYNISNIKQNTKMKFAVIIPNNNNVGENVQIEIELDEGNYTELSLASALSYKMNDAVSKLINSNYENFSCIFNKVDKKIYFGNKAHSFHLLFGQQSLYNLNCNENINNKIFWTEKLEWGLGYYLGFEKSDYNQPKEVSQQFLFAHDYPTVWLYNQNQNVYYIETPKITNLRNNNNIYMEIDKYNHIDETLSNQNLTSNMFGNGGYNKVNSFFAKIPLNKEGFEENGMINQIFDSRNNGYYIFNNIEERISRLRFKFRDHNQMLINFNDVPFSFIIEFVSINDDIKQIHNISVPPSFI